MVKMGDWLSEAWGIVKGDMVTFALATLVAGLLAGTGILAGPMYVGFFIMVNKKLRGEQISVGDIFEGFQKFAPSLVAFLIVAIGGGLVGFLLTLTGVGAFIAPFLGLLIGGAIFYTFQIIAATDVDGVTAIKMSWEKVKPDYLMYCVTYLVYALVAQLGLIACIVGVFVTAAIMGVAMAIAYRDNFGMDGVAAAPAPPPAAPPAPPPAAVGPAPEPKPEEPAAPVAEAPLPEPPAPEPSAPEPADMAEPSDAPDAGE